MPNRLRKSPNFWRGLAITVNAIETYIDWLVRKREILSALENDDGTFEINSKFVVDRKEIIEEDVNKLAVRVKGKVYLCRDRVSYNEITRDENEHFRLDCTIE